MAGRLLSQVLKDDDQVRGRIQDFEWGGEPRIP